MNTDERNRYFQELSRNLQHEGLIVKPETEEGLLPVELDGQRLCLALDTGAVRYWKEDVADDHRSAVLNRVTDIAKITAEYMRQMEAAPQLTASSLTGDYRLLAEFNDTVLAGHPSKYGVQFITWEWVQDHTALYQGNYYGPEGGTDSYAAAKRSFAVRSSLIPRSALARLNELPVHEWHGGKVHFIRPHVIRLMRGQLYNIEGHTFFTMGGAQSHDIEDGILDPEASDFEETLQRLRDQDRKRFRILGRSWWPEELPSDTEYMEALNTLELAGWKADYVITHCAPTSIARTMNRHYQPDALTDFLELVNRKLDFKCWFLGHYHGNRALTAKHILLLEQIIQIL